MVIDSEVAALLGVWCGAVALILLIVWDTRHCHGCQCPRPKDRLPL